MKNNISKIIFLSLISTQISIANDNFFDHLKTESIKISGNAKLTEIRAKTLMAHGRLGLLNSIVDSMIVNGALNCTRVKSNVIVVDGPCCFEQVAVGRLLVRIKENDMFDEYNGKLQTLILKDVIADKIFIETSTAITIEILGKSVIGSIHFIEGQPCNLENNSSTASAAIYIHRVDDFGELSNIS